MDKFTNINLDTEAVEATSYCGDRGQSLDKIRSKWENTFKDNEEYQRYGGKLLECKIYLRQDCLGEAELIFVFQSLFTIGIEGIIYESRLENIERLKLPDEDGQGFRYLGSTKCIPERVINASKTNTFNKKDKEPIDWVIFALKSLNLVNLVDMIEKESLLDASNDRSVQESTKGFFGQFKDCIKKKFGEDKGKKEFRDKCKVAEFETPCDDSDEEEIPIEYDSQVRKAEVIRFSDKLGYGILLSFKDNSFRTIRGIWSENNMKPFLEKQRPPDQHAEYTIIGEIEISPAQLREIVVNNPVNESPENDEEKWCQKFCDSINVNYNTTDGKKWDYKPPISYNPLPFSKISFLCKS